MRLCGFKNCKNKSTNEWMEFNKRAAWLHNQVVFGAIVRSMWENAHWECFKVSAFPLEDRSALKRKWSASRLHRRRSECVILMHREVEALSAWLGGQTAWRKCQGRVLSSAKKAKQWIRQIIKALYSSHSSSECRTLDCSWSTSRLAITT